MPDDIDWSLTTFDGLRLHQQRQFKALPLREKLERLEQMNEVVAFFAARHGARVRAGGSSHTPPHATERSLKSERS